MNMSKVLVDGKGRQCYKYISYTAERRPGTLQEFFDSTEGNYNSEATHCFLLFFLTVFQFLGKFHTTEVKHWVDELNSERSKKH